MLLIDDPQKICVEPITAAKDSMEVLYDWRSVLGASPAIRSASSQYSGWLVNWSQATTAHLLMSQSTRHPCW